MGETSEPIRVTDAGALAELKKAETLEQKARGVTDEIMRLLGPVQDKLSTLLLERDRLSYEGLAARQRFFQAARQSDPRLKGASGLRYERIGSEVLVTWDERGPRFAEGETAEPPDLHAFKERGPGRRSIDFFYK